MMGSADKGLCDEVRNLFLEKGGLENYYESDVERIKTDDMYVSRFISHQKQDKVEAANMIVSVLTWRKQVEVLELDYSKVTEPKLQSIYFRNKDNDGDDILWLEVKHYDKTMRDEYTKYLTWLVEHRTGAENSSQITCVFALNDVGMAQADVEFLKYFINLFMYYTPDTMKLLVVHNMHWLLNGVWKVVSMLLSEGAKKRVMFCKGEQIYDSLPKASVVSLCGGPDPYKFELTA